MWNHYGLPMMITENGFGAHESKDENDEVHDPERIAFLRGQIEQVGLAIADGCKVIAYNPWSFTDLLSTGNGIEKRYGLVFVDATDDDLNKAKETGEAPSLRRIPKDSFYWYSKVIKSNGSDL